MILRWSYLSGPSRSLPIGHVLMSQLFLDRSDALYSRQDCKVSLYYSVFEFFRVSSSIIVVFLCRQHHPALIWDVHSVLKPRNETFWSSLCHSVFNMLYWNISRWVSFDTFTLSIPFPAWRPSSSCAPLNVVDCAGTPDLSSFLPQTHVQERGGCFL